MTSKQEIEQAVKQYLNRFANEKERIRIFTDFLLRTAEKDLYHRKNFDGHITTSAFIIDTQRKEMLLLRHKSLGRWLQPGGHVEEDASLVASAIREACEETGIGTEELEYIPIDDNKEVPFDIDPHYIPPNAKKNEEGHYHHDLRYLLRYTGNHENAYNTDEATGMKWVSYHGLATDETFMTVMNKIALLKLIV